MTNIDQSGVIEQLVAENKLLRETLRHSPDKEVQVAAALTMIMDELTRLGPHATGRVLDWVFQRYGVAGTISRRDTRDRRPTTAAPAKQEPAAPVGKLARRHALRQARVAAGLTQTVLAERTGIAAPRISQIELGNTKPSEDIWVRLEKAISEGGSSS